MPDGRAERVQDIDAESVSGVTPRLYERATQLIAEQIRDGTLPASDHLTESLLAERLGISRAPVRRALSELEQQGLVKRVKGKGYAVLAGSASTRKAPSPGDTASPTHDGSPLQSSPSWERIYGEVEDQVIARISFASWRVNEARLARHYGVSRTVARDVVGRLQQRGVLRKDDRGRWYAPALTPDHIAELYELRAILEPIALTKAAPHAPASLLTQMRTRLEEAMAAGDVTGATLDALEKDLHVTLLDLSGTYALMQAITLPQSLLIAHRFLYRWTPRLFDAEPFLPEHVAVIDHLLAGETDRAAKALADHLIISGDRAISRVDLIRREFDAEDLSYLERLPAE
ncbi:GntR family transcriptional regulator [Aurantimonas coralicida]|uniref:GntR family transcriptional regulator n=1 Tax=Aurantimonas coralicida TaxID=182270 RepID=UPI001E476993|nr:GntR family transcriptional regulator [Aurantimonas coralicida]MCD1643510.1 GntR family transcriptional regulator [Aurantimonas coralicida]